MRKKPIPEVIREPLKRTRFICGLAYNPLVIDVAISRSCAAMAKPWKSCDNASEPPLFGLMLMLLWCLCRYDQCCQSNCVTPL